MKHLHFVQSLEPLQGAGLGYAALGMHEGLVSAGLESRLVATRGPVCSEQSTIGGCRAAERRETASSQLPEGTLRRQRATDTASVAGKGEEVGGEGFRRRGVGSSEGVKEETTQEGGCNGLLAEQTARPATRRSEGGKVGKGEGCNVRGEEGEGEKQALLSNLHTFALSHGGRMQVLEFERSGPTKLFFAPGMRNAAREMVGRADVVHGHGFYVYPNLCLGREARRQGKPLVYHVHGFLDPWILKRSRFKKRLVHWLFEDANFRKVAFWRAVTRKEEQQIRAYGITSPIEVIPNGVSLPSERSEMELAELERKFPKQQRRRMVFLSRIHPKKGIDILLEALSGLRPSLTDWEVALFGPDEGGYLAVMQGKARELELEEICTFYGSVSGADKEAALRSADLFVLPSYSEGFPMAVLEAAAYAIPVVQTTECNFSELTQAGGAWECAPNAHSLTQALQEALSADDAERTERGRLGRDLVARSYDWKTLALKLDEACQRHC